MDIQNFCIETKKIAFDNLKPSTFQKKIANTIFATNNAKK